MLFQTFCTDTGYAAPPESYGSLRCGFSCAEHVSPFLSRSECRSAKMVPTPQIVKVQGVPQICSYFPQEHHHTLRTGCNIYVIQRILSAACMIRDTKRSANESIWDIPSKVNHSWQKCPYKSKSRDCRKNGQRRGFLPPTWLAGSAQQGEERHFKYVGCVQEGRKAQSRWFCCASV